MDNVEHTGLLFHGCNCTAQFDETIFTNRQRSEYSTPPQSFDLQILSFDFLRFTRSRESTVREKSAALTLNRIMRGKYHYCGSIQTRYVPF